TREKDLLIQRGCELAKYWAQLQVHSLWPWVCIIGSVYLEKPIVEPLTDFILIADCSEDNKKRLDKSKAEKIQRLTEELRDLIWKAKTNKRKIIIVKFTKSDINLLHNKKIIYTDDESFKGWQMVISDENEKSQEGLLKLHK
ncbi:5167_t:CDS:2, partial [Dentiscutata erythropus]